MRAVGRPALARARRCESSPAPPEAIRCASGAARATSREQREVESLQRSVARDGGHHQPAHALASQLAPRTRRRRGPWPPSSRRVAARPSLTSIPQAMRSAENRATALPASAGFSTAAVPRMTRAAPASASRPRPRNRGCRRRPARARAPPRPRCADQRQLPRAADAASRSTTCRVRAPCSTQRARLRRGIVGVALRGLRGRPCAAGPRALRAGRSPGRAAPSCRALRQGEEPAEQGLAVRGALLRMVLDAEQPAARPHGGDPHLAVPDDRLGDARGRLAAVRMREVGPPRRLQRAGSGRLQLLPADVRNGDRGGQPRDPRRGAGPARLARRPLLLPRRAAACRGRSRGRGTPRQRAASSAGLKGAARSMPSPNAATPGRMTRGARSSAAGSVTSAGSPPARRSACTTDPRLPRRRSTTATFTALLWCWAPPPRCARRSPPPAAGPGQTT